MTCGWGVAAAVLTVTVIDVAVGITLATTLSRPEEESPEDRAGWDFPAPGFTNFHISWTWDFLNRELKEDCPLLLLPSKNSFQGKSTFPMSK